MSFQPGDYVECINDIPRAECLGDGFMRKGDRYLVYSVHTDGLELTGDRGRIWSMWRFAPVAFKTAHVDGKIRSRRGQTIVVTDPGSTDRYKPSTIPYSDSYKLRRLMSLLAYSWFHGGWKIETGAERSMQEMLEDHGWWPFPTEAHLNEALDSLAKEGLIEVVDALVGHGHDGGPVNVGD